MNDIDNVIRKIKQYPYKIAQDIGFVDVRQFPHNEWMKNIINGKSDYTLLAHRGSFKSSILSVCIAIIMIVYPQTNIIFLRKADNDVTEMIRMVKKALESEALKSLAMILYKRRIEFKETTASSITTNLFISASGSSQLLGIGLKSSITGKHADLVLTDDICNVTDRISKAERDRTKLQYQELQNICNRGGRIVNLGTKWHADDVFSLIDNIDVYDYRRTGLISDEQLKKIRDSMTPALFACNYELRIIASEDVIFTNPHTDGDPAMIEQGDCHVDAAYGGEDYTAFTIYKKQDGKYYLFGKLWKKHVDDCLDEICKLYDQFNAGRIWCEDNGDKGYLAKDLRKRGKRAVSYHESMNKYLKITIYLKSAWNDAIFVTGTDKGYINQICDYNENADHDDAPDSAASAIRRVWQKKSDEKYIPIW